MRVKCLIILAGICMLVAGCATDGSSGGIYAFNGTKSNSDTGVQYLLGRGVPQNNEKAFYYFSRAADQGDVLAQNEVAYMYATGKGTPRDNEKALMYYQEAANSGLVSAQYNLGLMYLRGIGTTKNKQEALAWLKKSASRGFEPAKVALKRYKA